MKTLGWHNFSNELVLFHGALRQFLREPEKEIQRMRLEAVSMKKFIESIIDTPKEEDDGNNQ
jgi:hypothetical protein